MACKTQKALIDSANAFGSTLFGLRLYFGTSVVVSGGPRIGGVLAPMFDLGSLWGVASTASGSSALGGPRLRFAASGVWAGFLPVTSPRAICCHSAQTRWRNDTAEQNFPRGEMWGDVGN